MSTEQTTHAVSEEVERVVQAAHDALTDDMVTRLSGTASDAIDLLDRVGRSGLDKAIPVLAEMVNNGDLERLAQLARVVGAAQDAVTDEMVGRLSEAVSGGVELIDQVNRSGLEKALPILSRLVNDGDLERIAQLARVLGSAQDAMTDDMVGRLADTLSNGMTLVDRLNRGGADRLVSLLERMESNGSLERLVDGLPKLLGRVSMLEQMLTCFESASSEVKPERASGGGVGPLWQMMRDAENQETLRFMLALGKHLRTRCANTPS